MRVEPVRGHGAAVFGWYFILRIRIWWASGIFRDVYVVRRPQTHLKDFMVRTTCVDDTSHGSPCRLGPKGSPASNGPFCVTGNIVSAAHWIRANAVMNIPDPEYIGNRTSVPSDMRMRIVGRGTVLTNKAASPDWPKSPSRWLMYLNGYCRPSPCTGSTGTIALPRQRARAVSKGARVP